MRDLMGSTGGDPPGRLVMRTTDVRDMEDWCHTRSACLPGCRLSSAAPSIRDPSGLASVAKADQGAGCWDPDGMICSAGWFTDAGFVASRVRLSLPRELRAWKPQHSTGSREWHSADRGGISSGLCLLRRPHCVCPRFGSHKLNQTESCLSAGYVPPRQTVRNTRCRAKRSVLTTGSHLTAT